MWTRDHEDTQYGSRDFFLLRWWCVWSIISEIKSNGHLFLKLPSIFFGLDLLETPSLITLSTPYSHVIIEGRIRDIEVRDQYNSRKTLERDILISLPNHFCFQYHFTIFVWIFSKTWKFTWKDSTLEETKATFLKWLGDKQIIFFKLKKKNANFVLLVFRKTSHVNNTLYL